MHIYIGINKTVGYGPWNEKIIGSVARGRAHYAFANKTQAEIACALAVNGTLCGMGRVMRANNEKGYCAAGFNRDR